MAAVVEEAPVPKPYSTASNTNTERRALSTYLGLSFAIFLGFLPHSLSCLQLKLLEAEEQLTQMKSRRKEDSKANARVVEIFASHRNGWRQEEKRLLHQIDASAEEIALLRARIHELEKSEAQFSLCVDKLQRDVDERDEMINFISRRNNKDDHQFAVDKLEVNKEAEEDEVGAGFYGTYTSSRYMVDDEDFREMRVSQEEFLMDRDTHHPGFLIPQHNPIPSPTHCHQDLQCDSLESSYQTKHFVARRESPWKVDGESIGVPSKLKVLEQELMNLEKVDKGELSKIPSLLRKQARRYQALAGKIDELCRKMRANEVSEPTLSFEFRTRYQTEFLIEAYRLQQRAIEIGQKLSMLQAETAKSNFSNDIESHAKLTTRRSLDSIRNNLREIQRNLEVWLARILGDLEGILASDGASRVREYYMSGYPFQ